METVCMILLKDFEIRTVLYENDLVANGTCHNHRKFSQHKIEFTAL